MKKIVTVLSATLLWAATGTSQTITKSYGYHGLNFPSGQAALPLEYHKILYEEDAYNGMIYLCCKDGDWGVYNMSDSSFTGCIYDTVYFERGPVLVTQIDTLLGFLGRDVNTGHMQMVEPQFERISVMEDLINRYDSITGAPSNTRVRGASVRKNGLWGVVNFADGSPWIGCRYKSVIETVGVTPLFRSRDPENQREIYIHPFRKMEFETAIKPYLYYSTEWNLLYVCDDRSDSLPSTVQVWQYRTAELLFSYTSDAPRLHVRPYSDQVFMLLELIPTKHGITRRFSFWNVTNHARLFSCTIDHNDRIHVEELPDKFIIYRDVNSNPQRRRQVGMVYK